MPDPTTDQIIAGYNDGNQDIICPFCGEDDFDLIGLKMHLSLWCDRHDKTEVRSLLLVEPTEPHA